MLVKHSPGSSPALEKCWRILGAHRLSTSRCRSIEEGLLGKGRERGREGGAVGGKEREKGVGGRRKERDSKLEGEGKWRLRSYR